MTEQPPSTALAVVDTSPRTGGEVAPIVPKTLDEMFFVAETMHKSGLAPKTLDTTEKVMVAMMAGAELGFAPFQAVQSFYVVGGRPVIFGDAIPAILLRNGFKVKEWFEGEADDYPDDMAAWCEIARPDGVTLKRSFSVADAKRAKLWAKAGPWTEYPRRMLQMRSRAFAARDNAADALKGFQIREEVQDFNDLRDVTPGKSDLRSRLEANHGERTEGFTVENVLDEIQPVQQEKPRRTRRTRPQIELDEKVSALFDGGASDAGDIAEQTGASEADVVESLQRLGITSIIPDENEVDDGPPTYARVDVTGVNVAAEDDTIILPQGTSGGTVGAFAIVDPESGEKIYEGDLGESAPAAEPPAEPEQAAEPASPDGTAAEAGTDGTGEPTSEPDEHGLTEEQYRMRVDAPYETEEAEVDEGESQPTSAVSPGPVDLYRMALANAGDFASVHSLVTEFRKAEAFQQADAAARIEINRSAVDRLTRMREGGVDVPTPAESVWLFALWMPLSDNEALSRVFDDLQQAADWDATPQDRQAIIASAVRERVGGLI